MVRVIMTVFGTTIGVAFGATLGGTIFDLPFGARSGFAAFFPKL